MPEGQKNGRGRDPSPSEEGVMRRVEAEVDPKDEIAEIVELLDGNPWN